MVNDTLEIQIRRIGAKIIDQLAGEDAILVSTTLLELARFTLKEHYTRKHALDLIKLFVDDCETQEYKSVQ
jgi:hypothetical protein